MGPESLGFVDIQVNGYLGISFSSDDLTVERCAECCRAILSKGGGAAIVPTMITSAPATYAKNLPIIAEVIEMPEFQDRLLGIHLEGPFISAEPGAVGAHPGEHAVSPAADKSDAVALLMRWQALARGHIVLITLAAELAARPSSARRCDEHRCRWPPDGGRRRPRPAGQGRRDAGDPPGQRATKYDPSPR